MSRSYWKPAALAFSTLVATSLAQSNLPQSIPFNISGSHGPDGPWNYISLNMGDSPQSIVDFYPMFGSPASLVMASSSCANGNKQCISPVPGYYNTRSESAQEAGSNTTLVDANVGVPNVPIGANLVGNGYMSVDTVNTQPGVENMTIYVSSNITSHDASESYVPISLLSLEPATNNATQLANGRVSPGQQTILQEYTDNTDGSGTIGLHMGSAAFGQPGSLYLGGYDQNRLIEPPAVFENVGGVNLSSISFGHAAGLDPWANSAQPVSNFLPNNQDLTVYFSPHVGNLFLPQSVCNLFMQYLPITYDDDTNLYLWNTSAPLYSALMSSPSYMNFTFHDSASTSIKIPFALLNLTLTSPVKDTPTAYFPCQPRTDTINLGRAFLQGAMYIQSYNPARIIVGQAPGPSVNGSANAQRLDATNPSATQASGAPRWNDTWAAHLTPLSSAPKFTGSAAPNLNSSASSTSNSSSGLSGGAIAGIVIGVVVGLALIAGAIFFFLIRKRRAVKASVVPSLEQGTVNGMAAGTYEKAAGTYEKKAGTTGLPGTPAPAYSSAAGASGTGGVAPAFGGVQEIDGREGMRIHEAGGNHVAEAPGQGFVAEMPDTSSRAEVGGVDTQRWSRT